MLKFILFCVTLDLSDNLTETRIVKNSSVTPCTFKLSGSQHYKSDQIRILPWKSGIKFNSSETAKFGNKFYSDFESVHVYLCLAGITIKTLIGYYVLSENSFLHTVKL